MFPSLPDKPDHDSLERAILQFWSDNDIFRELRSKNADGPTFSFIDGPVTANKTLGVHTAWGRTLKDVFQRYKALRGFHQRYQNGFDCQGLWIEVGVERKLGLNSKREIEDYGLEKFARECRAVVEWSVGELITGSIRLGQWMDWGNDYLTSADANIEYIWKFLKIISERGWLYQGHRATEWCPRCGTSISAHELMGSYSDIDSPSVEVRFPLADRPGQALVIWTTTPWTLPANVAVAVNPDAEYGRTAEGDWVAVASKPARHYVEVVQGANLEGLRYHGPFDDLPAQSQVDHRVVLWNEVSLDDGTGLVHIAPGCGTEDFQLGQVNGLDILGPVDEAGNYYDGYGWLAGQNVSDVTDAVLESLASRGFLVSSGTVNHRYPECWRCHTPLIYRISDDWFIRVADIREPMREANAAVEWTPAYMGKRMDDWLVNMSDWNISRRRYYGLPLPFYPCNCGHVTVIGSRSELATRATGSLEGLEQLRRPWIDRIRIGCEKCGAEVARVPEVGDVWLDAGIVPFSTLGWENAEAVEGGFGTGAAAGLSGADLPDHQSWERWFPADWVSEMREQIRLWFYAQLFMSVALVGKAPYRRVLGYEKLLDETGRPMHGSWGNMISATDAFSMMGADVMRWQYCAQPASQDLWFGFTEGRLIQRKLLTLWNCAKFFVDYARLADFAPALSDLEYESVPDANLLDRWLRERTKRLVQDVTAAYEEYSTAQVIRAADGFIDELSNWYVRCSRRRFWDGQESALRELWVALITCQRLLSPIMPFLTEHLWQQLVRPVLPTAPVSIFLAGWPEVSQPDDGLLREMEEAKRAVELGRQARAKSGHRTRQPLRQATIDGLDGSRFAGLIADELRVKALEFGRLAATRPKVKLNYRLIGPRLGPAVTEVATAIGRGEYELRGDGSVLAAGHVLAADEVFTEGDMLAGWSVASLDGLTVGVSTTLDDDLIREGRANDIIRAVNAARKELGLRIEDRIELTLPVTAADLESHFPVIAGETLATTITVSPLDAADGPFQITRVTEISEPSPAGGR